jgi:hypothetical protein
LGTPAKSASGAMIGIVTVARPEDEGIKNESGRYSSATVLMNATPPRFTTSCSAQLRTVSMIKPLFMTTETPHERHSEKIAGAVDESPG